MRRYDLVPQEYRHMVDTAAGMLREGRSPDAVARYFRQLDFNPDMAQLMVEAALELAQPRVRVRVKNAPTWLGITVSIVGVGAWMQQLVAATLGSGGSVVGQLAFGLVLFLIFVNGLSLMAAQIYYSFVLQEEGEEAFGVEQFKVPGRTGPLCVVYGVTMLVLFAAAKVII